MIKPDYKIRSNFEIIEINYPVEEKEKTLYSIGCLHVGSAEFSRDRWKKAKSLIKGNPVCLCGDLMDNATKTSKSNTYNQTMSPQDQVAWLESELYDLKDDIVCMVDGNHERRTAKDSDSNRLFEVSKTLGISDRYRRGMAFVKLGVGMKPNGKQVKYMGCVMHKTNKTMRYHFADSIDGIDFYVSAHTHTPSDMPKAKLKVDPYNNKVTKVPYETIVIGSMMDYGGYAVDEAYRVPSEKMFKLRLNGTDKRMETIGFYL